MLRVECKFTTGRTIKLPRRELEALYVQRENAAGIIAVLFWHGVSDPNGRWVLVDAKESVHPGSAVVVNLGFKDLVRLDRTQEWLAGIREHVAEYWRPFLAAFWELSLQGHDTLCAELGALHADGKLREQVECYRGSVLEVDHRNSIQNIVRKLGESVAGHVFQDLFAYLLGMAGYRTVRMNAVGVPDIELEELERNNSTDDRVVVSFSYDQLERVIDLAQTAGEEPLARMLRESMRQHSSR